MSLKNTLALPQFPKAYSVNVTTANTNYTAPSNTGLLWVAGPDGSDIFQIAAAATATQTSASICQLYSSFDFGSTFSLLPIAGSFAASGVAGSAVVNLAMPNGVPMGPSNALLVGGVPGSFTHTMAQSLLTESTTAYQGATPTTGSANAQVLVHAYNPAGTQLGAAPSAGTILDFVCGVTNSGATTLQAGAAGAGVSVTRWEGTALSSGDLTKGFRYRAIHTGTTWLLLPTQRLYVAVSQSQAATFTAWGADR